jgi:hypothetical protein
VYVLLIHPAVEVGRSPAWHGKQVLGALDPRRWNFPPAQETPGIAVSPWHWTQSANASGDW